MNNNVYVIISIRMNNHQQLRLLFILNFFKDMNLISVVLSPFMIYANLTLSDYILTVSIFRLTQVCFSIPAGMLADKLKPSFSLRLSAIFYGIAFLFLFNDKPNFYMFACFNILNSLSVCLMISSNKKLKYIVQDSTLFIEKYAHKISIRKLGIVVSGIISSILIASWGYLGLLYLQLFFCVVLLYVSFSLKEEVINQELSSHFSLKSIRSLKPILLQLPIKDMLQVVSTSVPFFIMLDVLLQPLMIEAKVTLWIFPLIIALSNLLIFISINKSTYLSTYFNVNPLINSFMPLAALVVYALTQNATLGLLGMIITIFSRCFSIVESGKFINKISPKKQSTIESILNTSNIIFVSIGSLIYAWLLKNFNLWHSSIIFLVVISLFIFALYFLMIKENKKVALSQSL